MSQKASAVKRAQQSEVQPHQPGQEVFKTILSEDVDWKPFPAFPPSVRLAVVVGQPSEPTLTQSGSKPILETTTRRRSLCDLTSRTLRFR